MSNGIGPDEVFQQRMILRKEVLETIEGNLNHADVFLGANQRDGSVCKIVSN